MISKISFFFWITFSVISVSLFAQDGKAAWDNTISKAWPEGFVPAEIKSSADGIMQKAIFYKSRKSASQPLIVSLHTWSGDFLQEDPLAKEVQLHDWNYIHPDFRGRNNRPEACGSELVVTDIQDAIEFAVKNGNVDTANVHIVGVSGGGYAALLTYLKLRYPVKSFNAWASISDLENWYWECQGRGLKYAGDLEMVTTGGKGFDAVEARKRSPMMMEYQPELRNGAFLNIYAGIHDGYTGSVPISHSVQFFNRMVDEMFPNHTGKKISDSTLISLLAKQTNPHPDTILMLGGRKIHLFRELPGLSLTIFEGTHEMIVPQALALVPVNGEKNIQKLNILTIGDSNGTFEYSWPQQLKKLLPFSKVVNRSISGNTIGFDNLDRPELNTLKNINRYLEEAFSEMENGKEFDYIFIGLGTNDTKRIFTDRQKEVANNLSSLIQMIQQFMLDYNRQIPAICILTPSPMDEQKVNQEKYGGGDERIQKNNRQFKKIARQNQVGFLDTYTSLKKGFPEKTEDGVHLNEKAQLDLANVIVDYLNM